MTDNEQRAAELLPSVLGVPARDTRDAIAAALDAAEARGRAQVAAKVETLADCNELVGPNRLRALVREVAR